jgi:hypothetical protein
MLPRLFHSLPCTLVLLAVAAPLPAHTQTTPNGHPAAYPTSTTLTCGSGGDFSQGEAIPLVATVTSPNGTPTDHVNFSQNNVSLGPVDLTNGTASLTAKAYAGTDTFVSTFPEQNGFASSSATCNVEVGALSLSSNNNPALAFSSITFIAHLFTQPLPGGNFTITLNNGAPMMMGGAGRNPAVAAYTTDTLTAGTYIVTATFTPDDGSAPATATITEIVTAATGDFTLNAYPPVISIRDGLTATGLISATSVDDFHGPVDFTCTLPQTVSYTCTLTPTSVQLMLNDYGASTIVLAPTKAPLAQNRRTPGPPNDARTLLAFLPLSLLSFAAFARRRRRSPLRSLLCVVVLTTLAACTTACGPDIFYAATLPGTYPVTITAVGTTPGEDPITHTLNITLDITQ